MKEKKTDYVRQATGRYADRQICRQQFQQPDKRIHQRKEGRAKAKEEEDGERRRKAGISDEMRSED